MVLDSVIYLFSLHNMFRPPGPDHVLATTGQSLTKPHRKWMWGLSQIIKISIFAEKVKVKALFDMRYLHNCFKKAAPRGEDYPSPPRPRAPPCRDISPPWAILHLLQFAGPGKHPARGGAWQHCSHCSHCNLCSHCYYYYYIVINREAPPPPPFGVT